MASSNSDWVDLGAEVGSKVDADPSAIDFTAVLSQTDPKINVFAEKAEDAEKEGKLLTPILE